MPYIGEQDRERAATRPETPGELNFALTCLIRDYFREQGANYGAANDVLGALEGAKLEFYRRVVTPYEDAKLLVNGDVY